MKNNAMANFIKVKKARRKDMASLSFEDKLRVVIKLQERAVSFHPELKMDGYPWKLEL